MTNNDFIEIYDNAFTPDECKQVINYFQEMQKLNLTFNRQESEDILLHEKNDETCFLLAPDTIGVDKTHPILMTILPKFWNCYKEYAKKYSILMRGAASGISSIRLQRTLPGGGYHVWHYETQGGKLYSSRFVAWMIYLNTIPLGGETEFLYQKTRVNAVEGRAVIWPAAYTHAHRGNQPLTGEKFVITGWVEYTE